MCEGRSYSPSITFSLGAFPESGLRPLKGVDVALDHDQGLGTRIAAACFSTQVVLEWPRRGV